MAIIRTRTRTNTTTIEQPANQRNKEFHMEDQTDLSSIVWRLQAQVSKMQKHHAEKVVAFWCENARLWGAHRLHQRGRPFIASCDFPNFVDLLDTLAARFDTQLATSQPHHLTFVSLVNIRQEKREPLRTFMERFRKVALNI
ncbi:hypothetical protein HKD37_03G008011 [Glycine soja]